MHSFRCSILWSSSTLTKWTLGKTSLFLYSHHNGNYHSAIISTLKPWIKFLMFCSAWETRVSIWCSIELVMKPSSSEIHCFIFSSLSTFIILESIMFKVSKSQIACLPVMECFNDSSSAFCDIMDDFSELDKLVNLFVKSIK